MNRAHAGRPRGRDEAHGGEDSRARGGPRVGIKAAAKGREGEAGLADAGRIPDESVCKYSPQSAL